MVLGALMRGLSHCMQVVLKKSTNKDKDGKIVNEKIVEFANRGYRALGVSKCNEMVSPLTLALHASRR